MFLGLRIYVFCIKMFLISCELFVYPAYKDIQWLLYLIFESTVYKWSDIAFIFFTKLYSNSARRTKSNDYNFVRAFNHETINQKSQ